MPRITDLDKYPLAYLTIPEFAEYLLVQDRTVRKWIGADVLPAFRFQGQWRIAKADAIAFIERARFQV